VPYQHFNQVLSEPFWEGVGKERTLSEVLRADYSDKFASRGDSKEIRFQADTSRRDIGGADTLHKIRGHPSYESHIMWEHDCSPCRYPRGGPNVGNLHDSAPLLHPKRFESQSKGGAP